MRLIWNEALRTGIEEVDQQHRQLIDIINELDFAWENNQSPEEFDRGIFLLSEYVVFHFGTEEALMFARDGGSPYVERHLGEHRQFIEHLETFKRLPEESRWQGVASLVDYLKVWLLAHVMGTDKQLASMEGCDGK